MITAVTALPLAKTGEAAKAGPIGLVVILLLCIACYFLFKSMSRHMRNVREQFPGAMPSKGALEPAPTAATAQPKQQPTPSPSPTPQPDDPPA